MVEWDQRKELEKDAEREVSSKRKWLLAVPLFSLNCCGYIILGFCSFDKCCSEHQLMQVQEKKLVLF